MSTEPGAKLTFMPPPPRLVAEVSLCLVGETFTTTSAVSTPDEVTTPQRGRTLSGFAAGLLAAVCVRDGWQFDELIAHYDISEHEAIQLFVPYVDR